MRTPEHSTAKIQVSPGKPGLVREIRYPLLRGAALAGRVVRDEDGAPMETATADLAQRVLRFLFRARHDEGLRFGG